RGQSARRLLQRADLPVRVAEGRVGRGEPEPDVSVRRIAGDRPHEHALGERILAVREVGPAQVRAPRHQHREEPEGDHDPEGELPALDAHPTRTSTWLASPARTVRRPSAPLRTRRRRAAVPSRISTATSRSGAIAPNSTTFSPSPASVRATRLPSRFHAVTRWLAWTR